MKTDELTEQSDLAPRLENALQEFLDTKLYLFEKPLTKEQLASHLSYSIPQIDKLMKAGILKPRRLADGMDPRFFLSEIQWK